MNKVNKKIVVGVVIGAVASTIFSFCLAETLIESKNISYIDNSKLGATNVQAAIDGTCTKFSNELQNFLLKVYPVGSIYISYSNTNPQTLFGGEWEQIEEGYSLVSTKSTSGEKGGAKTVTLEEDNLPSHSHSIPALSGLTSAAGGHTPSGSISTKELVGSFWDIAYQHSSNPGAANGIVTHGNMNNGGIFPTAIGEAGNIDGFTINATHNHTFTGNAVANHTHTVTTVADTTGNTGKGTSVNIQDPYITVYIWKRTK